MIALPLTVATGLAAAVLLFSCAAAGSTDNCASNRAATGAEASTWRDDFIGHPSLGRDISMLARRKSAQGKRMDLALHERGERGVDQAMPLDPRQAGESRRNDRQLVMAA